MNIKLAVFDFCPYCQRVRILSEYYRLPHEVIPIDPEQPPGWFSAASPRGKVPLLMVDDTPILESAVIGEFLDEISSGQLLAAEPLARARIRAWVEFVSGCQVSFGAMMRAADESAFLSAREALHADLAYVDQSLHEQGPFFGGDALCMVDIVFAPLLTRMLVLEPVLSCFPQDSAQAPSFGRGARRASRGQSVRRRRPDRRLYQHGEALGAERLCCIALVSRLTVGAPKPADLGPL